MALSLRNEVKSSKQLLEAFNKKAYGAEKLVFAGVGDKDVYNIVAPFIAGSVYHVYLWGVSFWWCRGRL